MAHARVELVRIMYKRTRRVVAGYPLQREFGFDARVYRSESESYYGQVLACDHHGRWLAEWVVHRDA